MRAAAGAGTAIAFIPCIRVIGLTGSTRIGVVRVVRIIRIIGIVRIIRIIRIIRVFWFSGFSCRLHLYFHYAVLDCQVSGPYQFIAIRYSKLAGIYIVITNRNFHGFRTYNLTIFIYVINRYGLSFRIRLLAVLADIDYEGAFCYKRITQCQHGVAFRYVLCQLIVIEDSISILIYKVVSSGNHIAILVHKLCINNSRSISYNLQFGSLSSEVAYERITGYNQLIAFRYIQLRVVEDSISV